MGATIKSVLDQTFRDFELLLILDPSTDRSEQIVRSFSDPRIRVLERSEPGPGGYAGRNLGIRESIADWIAFQDADDLWMENHLELLHNAITSGGKSASLLCTSYVTEVNGNRRPNLYHKKFLSKGNHYFEFADFLLYKPVNSINVAVKKSVFAESGTFPENGVTRGGDFDTWLRVMDVLRNGYWIKEITAVYNKNVSDGVIKSTTPLTYNHVVNLTVRQILKRETNPGIVFALKRFSNSFVKTGVKHQVKLGSLTRRDVQALFFDVYDRRAQLSLFRVLGTCPGWLQRSLTKIYGRLVRN